MQRAKGKSLERLFFIGNKFFLNLTIAVVLFLYCPKRWYPVKYRNVYQNPAGDQGKALEEAFRGEVQADDAEGHRGRCSRG